MSARVANCAGRAENVGVRIRAWGPCGFLSRLHEHVRVLRGLILEFRLPVFTAPCSGSYSVMSKVLHNKTVVDRSQLSIRVTPQK